MVCTMRTRDIDQAEAFGLLNAINWVKKENKSQIIIEGDNRKIMEGVSNPYRTTIGWEDTNIIR